MSDNILAKLTVSDKLSITIYHNFFKHTFKISIYLLGCLHIRSKWLPFSQLHPFVNNIGCSPTFDLFIILNEKQTESFE